MTISQPRQHNLLFASIVFISFADRFGLASFVILTHFQSLFDVEEKCR